MVLLTDSLGNSASTTVTVSGGVAITPANPSVSPRGSIAFSASGGAGPYRWSINAKSGGTIDANSGAYAAGATGATIDVVSVADSLGNGASVNVSVGDGIAINPALPTAPPRGTIAFGAVGGNGHYTWALTDNKSNGTIDAASGAYQAGSTGGVSDVVQVSDGVGNRASVAVVVGPPPSITPAEVTLAPRGKQSFGVKGGSGTGYVWSLATNRSGGSIDPTSGAYQAGSTGGVSDVVQVSDSLGNVNSASVVVGPVLTLAPRDANVAPRGTLKLTASGGAGGYVYALITNASGGSIDGSTGSYRAGAMPDVADMAQVTDGNGVVVRLTISVGHGISITPAQPEVAPRGSVHLIASGGSGSGYTWSLAERNSGAATIGSDGMYQAGDLGGVSDTVSVSDPLGNVATVQVSVAGGLAVTPAAPTAPPRGSIAFGVMGGSGSGYKWSLTVNASGGSIDADHGTYVAGTTPDVTDVVEVVDSLGNRKQVNVTVGPGLLLAPMSASVESGAVVRFTVAGGSGSGYQWSLDSNPSQATIDQMGQYTAGSMTGVDVVKVVDTLGNSATAMVTVKGGSGAPPPSDGGTTTDGGSAGTGGSGGSMGGAGQGGGHDGGCGCSVGGAPSPLPLASLLLVLGLVLALRWSRRSRPQRAEVAASAQADSDRA